MIKRKTKKLPIILTNEEVKKFLKSMNKFYPTSYRDRVLIFFMLECGLRISEVLNLKWKDLNLKTGEVKICQGKGSKDRMIFMSFSLQKELERFIIRHKNSFSQNPKDFVFHTLKTFKKLSPRAVYDKIQRKSKSIDLNKKISPHTFRHTFATNFYITFKDIASLKKILGHSSLTATMIYTHISPQEIKDYMRR